MEARGAVNFICLLSKADMMFFCNINLYRVFKAQELTFYELQLKIQVYFKYGSS